MFKNYLQLSGLKHQPFCCLSWLCKLPGLSWVVSSFDVGLGCSYLETWFRWNIKDVMLTWLAVGAGCGWNLTWSLNSSHPHGYSVWFGVLPAWWCESCSNKQVARTKKYNLLILRRLSCHLCCVLLVRIGTSPESRAAVTPDERNIMCSAHREESLGCIYGS